MHRTAVRKWSCRHSEVGAVYEFDFELSELEILDLSNTDDLFYVIYLCRIDLEDIADDVIDGFGNADIVSGFMLDGSICGFEKIAEEFNEGDLSFDEFYSKIKMFDQSKNQLCIKTDLALSKINAGLVKKHLTRKTNNTTVVEDKIIL